MVVSIIRNRFFHPSQKPWLVTVDILPKVGDVWLDHVVQEVWEHGQSDLIQAYVIVSQHPVSNHNAHRA